MGRDSCRSGPVPQAIGGGHNGLVNGASEPLPAAPSPALREEDPLEALASAALDLVRGGPLEQALAVLVRAAARATGAQVALARMLDDSAEALVTRAVHADSPALAAEFAGSRVPAAELGSEEEEFVAAPGNPEAPAAIRRAASRAGASHALVVPVPGERGIVGSLDLLRSGVGFSARERALARVAAAHLATAFRVERAGEADGRPELTSARLELLGEALAAGGEEGETAEQVARLAAGATGARAVAVWRVEADAAPSFLVGHGLEELSADAPAAAESVRRALDDPGGEPEIVDGRQVVTLPLGEPPAAALQLFFDEAPDEERLARLSPFAARASVALRRTRRVGLLTLALGRSQTLIEVVSQAIARLSLAHTLETVVERVAELTASKHVAVYLREGPGLTVAASRGLAGSQTELAERLLELALGPFRSRGYLFIEDMRLDPRLSGLESVQEESGVRRALFIPLIAHDEVIGALGVFRAKPRPYHEGEEGLLIALSGQLAVAVQNARLHEQTKELGRILEGTLESERHAARQLGGLYAISQSFAESLSLAATLEAVAKTMVELFDVDAAAIRIPAGRGEELEARVVHVADEGLRSPLEAIFSRPHVLRGPIVRRLVEEKRPLLLRPGSPEADEVEELLEPFLRQGSTAAVLPLATPAELLGTLTLVSLDPARPLDGEAVAAATAIIAQAALAIDNARLYQQQKDFTETMQRSLLPRQIPAVPGLDVGHVYQSSARVDVGGDVYDFLVLDEHRLAIVVGDVLGKGIQATADMAMAKFSFRALARAHPDASDFLAHANEVVVEEIEPGKFVTLVYALVDAAEREVACASAGHPPIRIVTPGGDVSAVAAAGLALGIEPGQVYESKRLRLEPGSAVVLYTDGVLEARRNGELYGEARLDRLLAARHGLGAQELAQAILDDCTNFSGGELGDDCAIVCLKLAP
jgi:serine phosphatase RsbU (regulator of sigma subunit)